MTEKFYRYITRKTAYLKHLRANGKNHWQKMNVIIGIYRYLKCVFIIDALRAHFHTQRRKKNSIADGSQAKILQRERRRSRRVKVYYVHAIGHAVKHGLPPLKPVYTRNVCVGFQCALSRKGEPEISHQCLSKGTTYPLLRIHQNEKDPQEIAAKIASVNDLFSNINFTRLVKY